MGIFYGLLFSTTATWRQAPHSQCTSISERTRCGAYSYRFNCMMTLTSVPALLFDRSQMVITTPSAHSAHTHSLLRFLAATLAVVLGAHTTLQCWRLIISRPVEARSTSVREATSCNVIRSDVKARVVTCGLYVKRLYHYGTGSTT